MAQIILISLVLHYHLILLRIVIEIDLDISQQPLKLSTNGLQKWNLRILFTQKTSQTILFGQLLCLLRTLARNYTSMVHTKLP